MKEDICPICGGIKVNSTTNFTLDYKTGLIVIREVPAIVCLQCGEDWISDETAVKLEEMVVLAKKQNQEFFVAKYSAYLLAS